MSNISDNISFIKKESSSNSIQFVLTNKNKFDPQLFLEECFKFFELEINNSFENQFKLEVTFCCKGNYSEKDSDETKEEEEDLIHFIETDSNKSILKGINLKNWFKFNVQEFILNEIIEIQKKNNWNLKEIIQLDVNINLEEKIIFEIKNSAFRSRLQTFALKNKIFICPKQFLQECFLYFESQVKKKLKTQFRIKVNCCFEALYIKEHIEFDEQNTLYVQTNNQPICRDTSLREWFIKNVEENILNKIEEFQENGSGWTLKEIIELSVNVND